MITLPSTNACGRDPMSDTSPETKKEHLPEEENPIPSHFPEFDEIQREIAKRIRDNQRFLERFMDDDFDDDSNEDEEEPSDEEL